MASSTRVLVVDDDDDFRALLRVRSRVEATIDLVGEAGDGDEAVVAWRQLQPDLVIMDVRMPGRSGIEAAAEILAERPDQPIVMVSADLGGASRRGAPLALDDWVDKADLPAVIAAVRRRSAV